MELQKKNFFWNIIGAGTNAFNSLFFIIIVTRINGVDDAGIFSFSFANACLLFVAGSYIIRAYQVTDTSGKFSDSDYVFNRVISCLVMIMLAFAFVFLKQYDVYKSSIIILLSLFKCAEAFSEVLYGIMQKNGYLYYAGISMTFKALSGVLVFLVIDYFTENMTLACFSLIIINVLYIFAYDAIILKRLKYLKSEFSLIKIRNLFVSGFYTFLLTVLGIYLINAPRYAIDDLMASSYQTIFGIIIIPATFMGLLGQYIIQPLLKDISEFINNKDYVKFKNTILKIYSALLLLGILVFICAYLLEEPVLSFIYGINLKAYKPHMMIIIAGAVMYGLQIITSYLLIALRKTLIQVFAFLSVSIFAGVLSGILVIRYSIMGASISYLLSMSFITILLVLCLFAEMIKFKKINKSGEKKENENSGYNTGI